MCLWQVLRFRKQHPESESAAAVPIVQGSNPFAAALAAAKAAGGAAEASGPPTKPTEEQWMQTHFSVTTANKHHIAECVAQGFAHEFVQEVLQDFYDKRGAALPPPSPRPLN